MRMPRHPDARRGVALIIVMVVIFVLAVLAGGFAYSMRVEMKLARNSFNDVEMEWLGRSGVELARYILAEQLRAPGPRHDALNQVWAGGPGLDLPDDSPLFEVSLTNNELGRGRFSIEITDLERKANINTVSPGVLQQALDVIHADPGAFPVILDSLQDWIDTDDDPRLSGAESSYYLGLDPPYFAKNGPIDDISELLLIRGVTPDMYWGIPGFELDGRDYQRLRHRDEGEEGYVGLVDLFSVLSRGPININTASRAGLQLIPGVDENIASGIIALRAGLDGMDGTEDDVPFASTGELVNVPGLAIPGLVEQLGQFASVQSITFQVAVDVEVDGYKRRFIGVVRRASQQDIPMLQAYWE